MISDENKIILIDFGMCARIDSNPNGGNELYSPPECKNSIPVVPSRDVFGVGVLMYEMLSGQNLFSKFSSNCRFVVIHIIARNVVCDLVV